MLKRLGISLVAASLFSVAMGGPLLAQDGEQETGQEPIVVGGRVEVPSAGYALTVPDGWVAFYPSADDAAAITDALRDIDPDLATTLEDALASGVGFSFLAFGEKDESGFQDNCNVIDYPTEGASLNMAVAADMAAMGDMGEALVGEPAVEIDRAAGGGVCAHRLRTGVPRRPGRLLGVLLHRWHDVPPADLHGDRAPR